jgi:hypothetical protein
MDIMNNICTIYLYLIFLNKKGGCRIERQLIGNPVHTFLYTFDCGKLNNGSHQFFFRTTSHNRLWNTVTRVHNF